MHIDQVNTMIYKVNFYKSKLFNECGIGNFLFFIFLLSTSRARRFSIIFWSNFSCTYMYGVYITCKYIMELLIVIITIKELCQTRGMLYVLNIATYTYTCDYAPSLVCNITYLPTDTYTQYLYLYAKVLKVPASIFSSEFVNSNHHVHLPYRKKVIHRFRNCRMSYVNASVLCFYFVLMI